MLTEPAAAQLRQGRQAGGQGMLLQPYTSRVVTENQAANVIPDNAVPVQRPELWSAAGAGLWLTRYWWGGKTVLLYIRKVPRGRSPRGVEQHISGQTSAVNAISCREGSFSYAQRNHSLHTGQFVHEKSSQVLHCLDVTLEKQPDGVGEDATEQEYLKFKSHQH